MDLHNRQITRTFVVQMNCYGQAGTGNTVIATRHGTRSEAQDTHTLRL